ncbi:MAG TPA: hypothetical protein VIG25_00435 [Pyrinomonadaceae bacterium]|jgi:hypothetical protein
MKVFIATLVIALAATFSFGQAPTLRIQADDGPNLPANLFYGDIKVKPLRLRPGTNIAITIQDADFFVTTHYTDFLSRFPEAAGLLFWQNEITGCGADAACIELKRVNVSGAFFLSIEFQETGYLVYKMNKAAFGNLPGKPVPVRRDTFMPDARTIANGVIVGVGNWQAQLEANKQAFALAFVQRPQFLTAFPNTLMAAEIVDKMNTNAGNVLSTGERSTLIGMLSSPGDVNQRAQVLRSIAENANLHQQEFNKAFVLMQYFGYLRRNPDDAPDTGFGGWQFWLDKLNANNGNFVQAEMVKAFIVSGEYLNRF